MQSSSLLIRMVEDLIFTPLSIIDTEGGDVLHAMKSSDVGFSGFGECYFSIVESGVIKGWKLHREMVLNLVVPVGCIRFVIFDDRANSITEGKFDEFVISRKNYGRLTVPPKLWVGFQGKGEKDSLLLNIASIPHDPGEMERKVLKGIDYNWSCADVEY
jgi:dTDP-4-dehydrorhamnose 3,5-epimerase